MSELQGYTYYESTFRLTETPNDDDYCQIYPDCRKYGPICQIRDIRTKPFGTFIIFVRTVKTDELKDQWDIQIGHRKYPIEWECDKPMRVGLPRIAESLKSPPAQQSPQNILNSLNDDCLRAIFESSILDLDDLCSLGSVCGHFNAIASQVCAMKYKDEKACRELLASESLWQIEEYFRIASITSIARIEYGYADTATIVGFILKYCRNLKKLDWNCAYEKSVSELQPKFDDLTHLTLHNVRQDFSATFTSNSPLEYLKISEMRAGFKLPQVQLPKLIKAEFEERKKAADIESFERFFQQNPQLRSLTIDSTILDAFGLDRAVRHLPNLQELRYIQSAYYASDVLPRYDFTAWCQFGQLKVLYLEGCDEIKCILRAIIDGQTPLDCLILHDFYYDSDYPITEIKQLTTVKCLKLGRVAHHTLTLRALDANAGNFEEIEIFTQRLSFEQIRDCLRELHGQAKLTFRLIYSGCEEMLCDEDVADEINEIRTKHNLDLNIVVEIDGESCDQEDEQELQDRVVEQAVLEEHQDWLSVQNIKSYKWYNNDDVDLWE